MSRSTREPWGWKVTIHVYGSGEPPFGDEIPHACKLVADALGADDFVGADVKIIQTKPADQVAT